MGEGKGSLFETPWLECSGNRMNKKDQLVDEDHDHSRSSSASSFEDSTVSDESSSSSSIETADDASSSVSSCLSSCNSNEGLYDLSQLMVELPIKRGLSRYYQGKSESFTCLSRVKSIEDLAKKITPYKKKLMMKSSKSYGGLDAYKSYTLPKRVISKRSTSLTSFASSSPRGASGRCPLVTVQESSGC